MSRKILLSLNFLALSYFLLFGRQDVRILAAMIFPMWIMSFNNWRKHGKEK